MAHLPGFTFGDLVRQPYIEAVNHTETWWDNSGNRVAAPEGGTFAGRLEFSPTFVASVIRNGYSRGGYLGLYEMAFLNPTMGVHPYDGEFYEPKDIGLKDVTLTWLDEEGVTKVLQRVARHRKNKVWKDVALWLLTWLILIVVSVSMMVIGVVAAKRAMDAVTNTSLPFRTGSTPSPSTNSTASARLG